MSAAKKAMTTCPVCHELIPKPRFLCIKHWRMVPPAVQRRVWEEYRKKPGSVAHRRAVLGAIMDVARAERGAAR